MILIITDHLIYVNLQSLSTIYKDTTFPLDFQFGDGKGGFILNMVVAQIRLMFFTGNFFNDADTKLALMCHQ